MEVRTKDLLAFDLWFFHVWALDFQQVALLLSASISTLTKVNLSVDFADLL